MPVGDGTTHPEVFARDPRLPVVAQTGQVIAWNASQPIAAGQSVGVPSTVGYGYYVAVQSQSAMQPLPVGPSSNDFWHFSLLSS